MRCVQCDTLNSDGARFCISCGVPLSVATQTLSRPSPVTLPPAAPLTKAATPTPASPPATTVNATPVPMLNQTISVTVQVPTAAPVPPVSPTPSPVFIVNQQTNNVGCLVRALYFCFIGLWLGIFWTVLAWLLMVTIIGLPLGILMLNRIPQVMTLRPVRTQTRVTSVGNVMVVQQGERSQYPFLLRAAYFVGVGWWLSALWLLAAWALVGISFGLGLPLAFWMFDRVPAIITLANQ